MFEPKSDDINVEYLKEYGWDGEGDPNEFIAEVEAKLNEEC